MNGFTIKPKGPFCVRSQLLDFHFDSIRRISGSTSGHGGKSAGMSATDPTFYRSPGAAGAAAPEQLAYVVAFDPAGHAKDALPVVDGDSTPSPPGLALGWSQLPTAGTELHHFGCSAG